MKHIMSRLVVSTIMVATLMSAQVASASPSSQLIDLGTLGGDSSYAVAINELGQVVGYSYIASEEYHAFLWENGAMTDLGTLGGNFSQAVAINERGQVVG